MTKEQIAELKEGKNLWDTKFEEVFPYDEKTDKFVLEQEPERFEPYTHQDDSFAEICGSIYCRCCQ